MHVLRAGMVYIEQGDDTWLFITRVDIYRAKPKLAGFVRKVLFFGQIIGLFFIFSVIRFWSTDPRSFEFACIVGH